MVTGLNIILKFQNPGSTFGVTRCCYRYTTSKFLCYEQHINLLLSAAKGCKCSSLFLAGNYSNRLLIVTLLLLAGDVELNPGPGYCPLFCVDCMRLMRIVRMEA